VVVARAAAEPALAARIVAGSSRVFMVDALSSRVWTTDGPVLRAPVYSDHEFILFNILTAIKI
jgi:hypothetical protein